MRRIRPSRASDEKETERQRGDEATVTEETSSSDRRHTAATAAPGIGFTVAITVWKREEMLPHALHSVLRQTQPCREVVVLSDGRSRAAADIVAPFEAGEAGADGSAVRYVAVRRQRKTWGNHLRRQALEEATSSHVVILGHDCYLYRGYLAGHRRNLGDDPDALSVVPVDYWRATYPDGRMPRREDVEHAGEAEIDLLCLAFPRRLALAVGCFDEAMVRTRCADYLSFDRVRRHKTPVYRGGESLAAHF